MESSMLLWLLIALGGFASLVMTFAFRKRAKVSIPRISEEDFDEVRRQVRQGRKIQAIKTYRQVTGAGLAFARKEVERIETDL